MIIPARNEAGHIGGAVRSIEQQDYSGRLSVLVVDDNSDDSTAEAVRGASSGVVLVTGGPVPPGWTGKMWAVHQGILHASAGNPDFFLLTDADIVHGADTVRGLLARAEEKSLDLVSYMVLLRTRTMAERLMMPAFVFFFLKLYPPDWIADPHRQTAGAAGGCIAAIRGELIDDCALARRVKDSGGRIWMGLTRSSHSTREYADFGDLWRMIARTAFTQLNCSPLLLAGTVAGMLTIYVSPVVLAFSRNRAAAALAASAWALMSALYAPMLRFYSLPVAYAPLLPAVALFYTAATVDSAVRHYLGRGGMWKGRVHSPAHLIARAAYELHLPISRLWRAS